MTIQSFQPGVNGDDGMIRGPGTWFQQYTGFGNYGGNEQHAWVRFPNVTIAQGTIISSAIIRFKALRSDATNVVTIIDGSTGNNPPAPVSFATYPTVGLTTAKVNWSPAAWTLDTEYDSDEIKTVVQEIIDQGTWDSGDAMLLLIHNNGSDGGAERYAYDYNDNPSFSAQLIINSGSPGPGRRGYPLFL